MISELKDNATENKAFLKRLKVWSDRDTSKKNAWLKNIGDLAKVYIAKERYYIRDILSR